MTSFSCHNILIKEENICMVCCVPFHLYCFFFHFMSTVYKRSHIGVVETSSDHQCEIDWYLHWSSLPLHLPSSQVENPRMDWDSILNGQICQTQEQPIFFLCWFCLRHGAEALSTFFLFRYLSQVWVKSHLSESNLSQNKTKKERIRDIIHIATKARICT